MRLILLNIFLIQTCFAFSQTDNSESHGHEYYLYGEWKLRKVGDDKWIDSVNFPNSVHKILWDKKIIENPYYGDNEKNLKWIEEADWEAEVEFDDYHFKSYNSNEMIFESLEPYVRVYLNDHFLFESKNAFVQYKFDVSEFINKDSNKNKLRLEMDSPIRRGKELQKQNKITLPGDERVYTRKPQYEYGWDWGPRFVKTGVKSWISIVSTQNKKIEIENHHITTLNLNKKTAELLFEIEVYSPEETEQFISISDGVNDYYSKKHKLSYGITKITIPVKISDPEIWWPNGMGNQSQYSFVISITSKKEGSIDNNLFYFKALQYAICDIKLIQEKNSNGKSFYFSINGKPTYLKGFNLIPESHISEFDNIIDNYSNLITKMKEMNCNAIRIWGGGEYLPDQVMEEFQSYGIIVWQDFMFAGGMYPGDTAFSKNVEEEITYQVKRLRNYNNIALYCGNNEIDEAWHNWGWQKQYNYSNEDSTKIWNDYQKLFHELIPSIVKKYDPDTDYIPSSPEIGWGRKESMTQGDSQYWGVWWGKEPIETFEEKIPRFMSEFGMQAMPDLSTLRKVIPDSLMNFDSPEFKNHQKHPTGFETLNYYLEKYLTVPTDMGDYIYATQLLQAITLQKAIEAQRLSQPRCMGTLIWQLNDTWPVTSWSVIDSEGRKKLAFEYVKKGFENELAGVQKNEKEYLFGVICNPNYYLQCIPDQYPCWYEINSDVSLKLEIRDLSGGIYFDTSMYVKLEPNKPTIFFSIKKEDLKNFNENNSYCKFTFNPNDEPKYTTSIIDYFVPLNKIQFEKPDMTFNTITVEKNVWKGNYTSETENIQFYEISCTTEKDLHFLQMNDTLQSEKLFYRFIEGPLRGYPNKVPTELLAGNEFKLLYRKSDFINEQSAINYVKKNLKSINHLLGK